MAFVVGARCGCSLWMFGLGSGGRDLVLAVQSEDICMDAFHALGKAANWCLKS